MKKKNGFTLIELLAIIILLGVISLIVTISVTALIDKSRKNAFKASSEKLYKDIIDANGLLEGSNSSVDYIEIVNGRVTTIEVNTEGSFAGSGYVIKDNDKYAYVISDSEYCGVKNFQDKKISYYDSDSKSCSPKIFGPESTDTSDANKPILEDNMIPIIFNTASNNVEVASGNNWYNYKDKKWANVAVLKDTSKTNDYAPGEKIAKNDIIAYFVWIPRFEYKYTNMGNKYAGGTLNNPGSFTINFIKANKVIPSSSEFKIHSAFTYDDNNNGIIESNENKSGFWISKYITSIDENDDCAKNSNSSNCDKINTEVNFTDNTLYALIYQSPYNQFMTAKKAGITFGFKNETKMIKLNEYFALLYLRHTIYGLCKNNDSCNVSLSGDYYRTLFDYYKYSTTGNVYGVYDTYGSILTRTMGGYNLKTIGNTFGNKGTDTFSGFTDLNVPNKYFTNLENTTTSACGGYCYDLFGLHGLYSGDVLSIPNGDNPWIAFYTNRKNYTSAYSFMREKGGNGSPYGFYITLTNENDG